MYMQIQDSRCTVTIFIPGPPLKNIRSTTTKQLDCKLQKETGCSQHTKVKLIFQNYSRSKGTHRCIHNLHIHKTLVDAGCEVKFNKYKFTVKYNERVVWHGEQEATIGLWILPLSQGGPEKIKQLKISPNRWMNTVEQLNQAHQANNV